MRMAVADSESLARAHLGIFWSARVPLRFGRATIRATDPFAQLLARLEMKGVPSRKRHRRTGFGVPPHSRRAETEQEAAKTSDLDSPTTGETRRHLVEHNLHRTLDVALGDLRLLLRNPLDQIGLRHEPIIAPALCDRDPRRRPPRSTAAKAASSSASVSGDPATRLRGANSGSTHKSRVVGIRTPHLPEPAMDHLSKILEHLHEQFGDFDWEDGDRVRTLIIKTIPSRVEKDRAVSNAKANSDRANARIEHDNALVRVITSLMKHDTQLFKLFRDNESFRRFVSDTSFYLTYG